MPSLIVMLTCSQLFIPSRQDLRTHLTHHPVLLPTEYMQLTLEPPLSLVPVLSDRLVGCYGWTHPEGCHQLQCVAGVEMLTEIGRAP